MSLPGVMLAAALAGPGAQVHTATADVRACAVAEAGDVVLAATDGGVVTMGPDGRDAHTLTVVDGLPGTRAEAILPLGEGQWWVGTEGGLARLRVAAGVPQIIERIEGPRVRTLARDGDDILVGTWGDGVQRLVEGRLQPVAYADGEPSAARRRVTSVARFEGAWVVATAAGLWRLGEGGLTRWSTELDDTIVWSLAVDDDRLWAGTLDGVYLGRDRLRRIAPMDARDVSPSGGRVHVATTGQGIASFVTATGRPAGTRLDRGAFVRDIDQAAGLRCVATDDGLWLDDGDDGEGLVTLRGGLPSNDVSAAVWDDATGRLWVGTFDRGLAYTDDTGWHRVGAAEVDPQINGLAIERRGGRSIVWVATARGIARIDGDAVRTWGRKAGLPHEHVLTIAVVDGRVVAGTARGFVTIEDGELSKPDRARKPEPWAVWSVDADDEGTLWLGTTEGLVAWPRQGSWRRYSMLDGSLPDDWVTAVRVEGDTLWVGTYAAGAVRLTEGEGSELRRHDLGGGRVNPAGLTVTRGHVYLATMGGLQQRTRWAQTWAEPDEPTPGRDVTAVVPTPQGLWVATRRGLVLYRQ